VDTAFPAAIQLPLDQDIVYHQSSFEVETPASTNESSDTSELRSAACEMTGCCVRLYTFVSAISF
jgi:hypothetical protein